MDHDALRTLVGILGNIIALILFLSPLPTFMKIVKAKSVQAYRPDPYVATILNCGMWMFYSLPIVHPDSLLVFTINCAGFTIEIVFITIFLTYSTWGGRKKIIIVLVMEALFAAAVVVVTLMCFHTYASRSLVVGMVCVFFNILMYAAPLTVMKMVIKTKSVKFMPLSLSVATFASSIVWSAYALLQFDPFILVPNALGTLFAIVQLILYATYYSSTDWGDVEQGEVQMLSISKA
ncbi:putative SWEET sugar transporter [Helianthus annuus]|nr:putative SWEET sugar transporter [Helianthus annuus]KAJ0890330.1 putative SWEET sugar transporter [Helianthus annuus]KAJ0895089.1 putative SWEET sugar transporter [Helianthus annuus]